MILKPKLQVDKIIIFVLLAVILFFGYLLTKKGNSTKQVDVSNSYATVSTAQPLTSEELEVQKQAWKKNFKELGSEKAYEQFKEAFKSANFGSQHIMAHIVGAEIYDLDGTGGINVCDGTFAFGCYHGYFVRILSQSGMDVIKKLDETCVDKFGTLGSGCQHGIGHGILEYLGHNKVVAALDQCKQTTTPSPVAGCTSGVFMEYFVPVIISDTETKFTARPLDEKKPFEICSTLPKEYRQSCYYAIGQWWNQTPLHQDYAKQGLYCSQVPDKEFKDDCYLGVGNEIAPSSSYNVEQAIAWCKQMPDQHGIVFCQAGASWSFDANPDYKKLAVQVCGSLEGNDLKECTNKAHLLNPENLK